MLGGRDLLGVEALGLGFALGLVFLLSVALREGARRLLRPPLLLLALHAVAFTALLILPPGAAAERLLRPLALLLLLGSIGRSGVLLVLDVLVGQRLGRPLPRIFREIVQGLVYAGAALFALREAGVEPGSLLTTSALLTAVIGLSLQETMGNLFAGLAVQIQAPFQVGDWIQFDENQKHIGKVVEINWRATKIETLEHLEISVPNGMLAKAPIINFTQPTRVSRRSVYVSASYSVAPVEVHGLILDAIHDVPGVVAEPAPSVVTNQFGEYGIEYWVRYFTDQFDRRDVVDGSVRDRIWYALRRAEVEIPYPHRTLEIHEVNEESSAREADRLLAVHERALAGVDIFRVLSPTELRALAELAHRRLYAPGEVIVRQGDDTHELFVIEQGEVVVSVPGASTPIEVARLGAGAFFGEMALVTGDVRQATVRAAGHCQLLGVGREAMGRILAQSPDLADRISIVLAERQAQLDEQKAASASPDEGDRESLVAADFVARIRKFFAR